MLAGTRERPPGSIRGRRRPASLWACVAREVQDIDGNLENDRELLDHRVLRGITPRKFQVVEERRQNSAAIGSAKPLRYYLLGQTGCLARFANDLSKRLHSPILLTMLIVKAQHPAPTDSFLDFRFTDRTRFGFW